MGHGPRVVVECHRGHVTRRRQDQLIVVVIGFIMAVAVHGPRQIFFKTMGMPVILDYLCMIGKGLEDFGLILG